MEIFFYNYITSILIQWKINKLIKDNLVTKLMGFNSYITSRKITSQQLKDRKKPFFLTIKLKEKFFFKINVYNIKIKLISKLFFFERKLKKIIQ